MITNELAILRYSLGLFLISSIYKFSAAAITHGSLSHNALFIFSLYCCIYTPGEVLIFCSTIMAFFRTRSLECVTSFTTGQVIALAIIGLMMLPKEVRLIIMSSLLLLLRSLRIVATSSISSSEDCVKNSEHIRQPIRLSLRFLSCVRLTAWMWANGALCPSISMYSERIRCSLSNLGGMFFSRSLGLSVTSSARMIRSYYCLDLASPIDLMNYFNSLERCCEEVIGARWYIYIYQRKRKNINQKQLATSSSISHGCGY